MRLFSSHRRAAAAVGAASALLLTTSAAWAIQQAKLVAQDASAGAFLGWSTALDGDTAVVGAREADSEAGAAYVFFRSGVGWSQQAKLVGSDTEAEDWLGQSVAIDADTVIVGALPDVDASVPEPGFAYIFVRSGSSWTEQAKLLPSISEIGGFAGTSVALDGDTAVIGAPGEDTDGAGAGAAYVFVRSGTAWTEQARLAPTVASLSFGDSVSISGDTMVVGASSDDENIFNGGAAFVFVRSGNTWSEQAKLWPSDLGHNDQFGLSVAVAGDTLVGGTYRDDDAGNESGSATVFTRSGTSWSQQAKLTASDAVANAVFGLSVAIDASGDTIACGAKGLSQNTGAAYKFRRNGNSWTQLGKLQGDDTEQSDELGYAVAVDGDTTLVGARSADNVAGAGYVFVPGLDVGETCANHIECKSGFCADGVCCQTECGGGDVSDCQVCSVAAGSSADGSCEVRAAGLQCRFAAGDCDVAEACDGSNPECPVDAFVAAGSECRPAAAACDVAETCNGSSPACAQDAQAADGTPCDDGNGCTAPDSCLAAVCTPGPNTCGDDDDDDDPDDDEGGCSCRLHSRPTCGPHGDAPAWLLGLLLAAATIASRRRCR